MQHEARAPTTPVVESIVQRAPPTTVWSAMHRMLYPAATTALPPPPPTWLRSLETLAENTFVQGAALASVVLAVGLATPVATLAAVTSLLPYVAMALLSPWVWEKIQAYFKELAGGLVVSGFAALGAFMLAAGSPFAAMIAAGAAAVGLLGGGLAVHYYRQLLAAILVTALGVRLSGAGGAAASQAGVRLGLGVLTANAGWIAGGVGAVLVGLSVRDWVANRQAALAPSGFAADSNKAS